MPLLTTRAGASSKAYGFGSAVSEELGGMVLIAPTSIASTGTGNSSSIGANGSVTFSSCATLSLNGVFSANYDNYLLVCRWQQLTADATIAFRLRASGVDENSGSNYYTRQYLQANGTTVDAGRASASLTWFTNSGTAQRNGLVKNLYGPYLTQPTAGRVMGADSESNAFLRDIAFTHSQSIAYDGFTISADYTFSGLVSVYGLVGA